MLDDGRPAGPEPTGTLDAVAVVFAALLVGPLVVYWALRLLASASRSVARTLVGPERE